MIPSEGVVGTGDFRFNVCVGYSCDCSCVLFKKRSLFNAVRYVCHTFDLMKFIFPPAILRLDHLCDVMSSHRITMNILRRELWKMSPSATKLLAALWTQKNV